MRYRDIFEIKKVLNDNPIPETDWVTGRLSQAKKQKYYQIIEDCLSSYRVDSEMSVVDLHVAIRQYILRVQQVNDFRIHYSNICAKVGQEFQNKVIEQMNSGVLYNYMDIQDIIDFLEICSSDSIDINHKLQFVPRDKYLRDRRELLEKYYKRFKTRAFIKLLKKGKSFDEVIKTVQIATDYDSKTMADFYKKAYAYGIPASDICDSFKKLNLNANIIYDSLKDIINKDKTGTFINYICDDIRLCSRYIIRSLRYDNYKSESFKKLCAYYREYSKTHENTEFVQLFFNNEIRTNEKYDRVKLLNILYDNYLVSDEFYDEFFHEYADGDLTLYSNYKKRGVPKDIIRYLSSKSIKADYFIASSAAWLCDKMPHDLHLELFKKIVSEEPKFLTYYRGNVFSVYAVALKNGATVSEDKLIDFLVKNKGLTDEDVALIFKALDIPPFDHTVLKSYNGVVSKLIRSFKIVGDFLSTLNIDKDSFLQYTLGSRNNWLDAILYINDNNKLEDFSKVKDFFFKYYYKLDDNKMSVLHIKSFLDILLNYVNYPELCMNIISSELSDIDISRIKTLFNNKRILRNDDESPITKKKELANVENIIFSNYRKDVRLAINSNNYDFIMRIICEILFNKNFQEVKNLLHTYGTVRDLRQLLFDNRENREISSDILEMMAYVSMMDDLCTCTDIEKLHSILKRIINDKKTYILCKKCNLVFRDFEDKMNSLYEKDLNINLTNINDLPDTLIDQEATSKYGVKFYDLSSSKYCLLEHVQSSKEEANSLINGIATGKQLFISLSLGSHRNQRLYRNAKYGIIFGCSKIPKNLFIRSSTVNISSNSHLNKYDCEVAFNNLNVKERGALETSSAFDGFNSEIICYREGLKFDCIIIPGDREPYDKELEIAKKYNLSLVRVQEINTAVLNPKPIEKTMRDDTNHQTSKSNEKEPLPLQTVLNKALHRGPRKIAIFTDAHGLFEPTLAVLEEARKEGITEIYSLGDNIGTGPNPKEVMDLLEVYNVKSLKGNHEMYALEEFDKLRPHLEAKNAISEAKRNGAWTRSQLTNEQLDKIKKLPENLTIEIGGKKVMLCHYSNDYNTEEKQNIPSDIDEVFQGHIHFENQKDNVTTVRAVGFGVDSGECNNAKYIILTEREDGGYDAEYKDIYYNNRRVKHDIIESDMNSEDKDKITSWIGRSR